MFTPLTPRQKTLLVNNVLSACKDIRTLKKNGYHFLYLSSGMIAHYNRGGFIDYYMDNDLATDIINNAQMNQWNNFRFGDRDYDYMMEKKDIYNRILAGLGIVDLGEHIPNKFWF
jgi:hypothetical protein